MVKVISIAYRRTDLIMLQKAAWEKFCPDTEFLVAAHYDHKLEINPDIEVSYHSDPRFQKWPFNFLVAAHQLLNGIDEDIIITEGDIFPIKPINLDDMLHPGTVRLWADVPYPGLIFMPKNRIGLDKLNPIVWRYLTEQDGLFSFPIKDDMKFELIGDKFLHWNSGDTSYSLTPELDPRRDVIKEFENWLDAPKVEGWISVGHDLLPEEAILAAEKLYYLPENEEEKNKQEDKSIQWRDKVAARKQICIKCDQLSGNRCSSLRKAIGCSVCSNPWMLRTTPCPKAKWDNKMQLYPDAIKIISKLATGRVLELGTGSCKGTEAALLHATEIITIDHLSSFHFIAKDKYKDNDKVTSLLCDLRYDTYNLPKDLGKFNTIIVDGPIGTEACGATLEKVIPMLEPDGIVIINDALRDAYVISKWADHYELSIQDFDTKKGMVVLSK